MPSRTRPGGRGDRRRIPECGVEDVRGGRRVETGRRWSGALGSGTVWEEPAAAGT